MYHITTDDLLLLDNKYTQFFKIQDGNQEITMSYECCMIYDALLNGIDLKNKESYILDYKPKNIFCNEDIFGILYSDIKLFYSRDLFNEFVEKSLNYPKSENYDKIQESLKVIYIKKSITLLKNFLNIIEDIINKKHEKYDCKYSVLSTLSEAILKKCNELKDDKEALQYLNYYKQYINSTLNGYENYLKEELSERNIQPLYPKSIFLQNKNIELGEFGEDNFIDLTNFVNNIKYNSRIEEGKDYFDIFIDHSQQILAYKKANDDNIDSKKLKFIEEQLNKFCEHIGMPRFLFDIVSSEEFAKMIGHEEVERKVTRIIDAIQCTENDLTDSESISQVDYSSGSLDDNRSPPPEDEKISSCVQEPKIEEGGKRGGFLTKPTENDLTDSESISQVDYSSGSLDDNRSPPPEDEKISSCVQEPKIEEGGKRGEFLTEPNEPYTLNSSDISNAKAQNLSCKGCCIIL